MPSKYGFGNTRKKSPYKMGKAHYGGDQKNPTKQKMTDKQQMKKKQAKLIKDDSKRAMYTASDTTDALKIAKDQRIMEGGFEGQQFSEAKTPTTGAYKNPAAVDIYSTTFESKGVKEVSDNYENEPARATQINLKKQQKLNKEERNKRIRQRVKMKSKGAQTPTRGL